VQQLKLLAVTALVTLLIWTTADQLLSDAVETRVSVRAAPGADSSMIVETDPPGVTTFLVRLVGPRRIVEQVRRDGLPQVTLRVPELANGSYPIDVRQKLSDYPEQFHGLRIDAVTPASLKVVIDHLVTVTVPVSVEPGDLQYEVPPTAEPDEVEATLSQRALEQIPPSDRRVLVNAPEVLQDKPSGVAQVIPGVPVVPRVAGVSARVVPNTVTLYATVREQSKTATIAAVPIHVATSFDVFSRFRIVTRDGSTLVTRAITVRGPPDVVDRLVSGGTRVTGLLSVSGDLAAVPAEYHELTPVFDLPPEVKLVAPVEPVEFRLVPLAELEQG